MYQKAELKDFMSMDEMTEACRVEWPFYIPNKQRVGRYAKKRGYVVRKQKIDGRQIYFYVKAEIAD